MAASLAPSATAAETKSISRMASTSPRVIRMIAGIWDTASAITTLRREGPRIAAMPTAKTRNGKASTTSTSRMTTGSSQRR
jgi:hypothetical protein